MVELERAHPLNLRQFALDGIFLMPAEPMDRISLRCDKSAEVAVEDTLGIKLPKSPKTSTTNDGVSALWLGPDEWLVIGSADGKLIKKLAKADHDLVSAVSIDHRNTAIMVSGKKSDMVLNAGCPLDLSLDAFPLNACTRTVLGKSEIVLWRLAEDRYHVECWRSFSDYVWKFLVDAAKLS